MSKWNETGILRKKPAKDNFDDLLVFGYACKLFRDDDKALYIDQGKHLIPWMGDDKIKIDRYDCRGALSDFTSCEASREGYDVMRWLGLSESERKIEQLCDEERYYSLLINEEEEAMYKEEELKRQNTNEFQYSYDVPTNPEQEKPKELVPTCEEEIKVFVPPPELDVPVDINIPKTVKENARIEKTALFISKQGPQMEILIKAKQAENPQFSFMNQSDPLYKYYRHVLGAIKSGIYKVHTDQDSKSEEEEHSISDGQSGSGDTHSHYLHPSLAAPPAPPPVTVPLPYKPAADCAYTQLISRIQGANPALCGDQQAVPVPQAHMTAEQQQQYQQYYYSAQYYEYYKQIASQYAVQAGCDPQTILQNQQLAEQIQQQASHYAQAAFAQYMQQHQTTNSYAQIVTNLAHSIKEIAADEPAPPKPTPPEPEKPKSNPLQSLVHYSSDSEEEEEEQKDEGAAKREEKPVSKTDIKVDYKQPPAETATIIDKMANYVSKNGSEFVSIVRAKNDPRFEFLNESHEYHKYYKFKLDGYRSDDIEQTVVKDQVQIEKNGSLKEKTKESKKVITPVSFSIKKPKEESPKEIRNALPVEESDDDADDKEEKEEESKEVSSTPPLPVVEADIVEAPSEPENETKVEVSLPPVSMVRVVRLNCDGKEKMVFDKREVKICDYVENDDPILEMIDLTDDLEERRDAKRAEDKIKDKLALAAKEKLALRSGKDRALQLERKKKAAMFLKLKTAENSSSTSAGECTRTVSLVVDDDDDEEAKSNRLKQKKDEILKIEDSESEEGEIKHKKSKKKKSHKRKASKSRKHESRSHHHKKSKKRRRRSSSRSSTQSRS